MRDVLVVTGLVLGFFGTLFSGAIFAVDALPLPDSGVVVDPIQSGAAMIAAHVQGMGYWVPFSTIGPALALLVLCIAASWGIRILRMVLSVMTGGGGSGA